MEFIRPGQTVDIKVDAFPSHKFTGKVNSISPATGAKFALLPPDNASGNFVKTVQRIPVKITFENQNDEVLKLLRPGMNVIVDVNIKETRKAEH
jgi:membrane fusion protein (multidrug efflux system)